MAASDRTLDPVTFEVLKNSFVTVVDEMAEQILRTCHSFVIFSRDFSCALHDARGDTIMQGSQDIAVHVGTLHLKAKAVLCPGLVKTGMIRLFKKKGDSQIELDTIHSGQVVGELAFLDGNPRSASGEALTDCDRRAH